MPLQSRLAAHLAVRKTRMSVSFWLIPALRCPGVDYTSRVLPRNLYSFTTCWSILQAIRLASRFQLLFRQSMVHDANCCNAHHSDAGESRKHKDLRSTESQLWTSVSDRWSAPGSGLTNGEVSQTDRVLSLALNPASANRCDAIGIGSGADACLGEDRDFFRDVGGLLSVVSVSFSPWLCLRDLVSLWFWTHGQTGHSTRQRHFTILTFRSSSRFSLAERRRTRNSQRKLDKFNGSDWCLTRRHWFRCCAWVSNERDFAWLLTTWCVIEAWCNASAWTL
jgi:hypothetical protein